MTADGRTARADDLHRRLLRTAREVVERHGTARLTMSELARTAGVSRRALYDHFGSRGGLFLALVDDADREAGLPERVRHVRAAPTGPQALERHVALVAEVSPRLFEVASAAERQRTIDPDVAAAWEDRMAGRLAGCREVVERLAAEGRLTPHLTVDRAADLLYAEISWQRWELLVVERGWTPEQWRQQTVAMLRAVLVESDGEGSDGRRTPGGATPRR
ncbi:MAG: helix-turn-helix domain-containing protein [Acidimicrobiia bacterium]|nr:helix-turn-helix domain-containing protein [Acidimicrobiia bacterium]